MSNIHLYIGNTEVEFEATPEILYTYQVDDLTNPTVVKNSFSKTITIKGTRSNNHLFGHYWNVERTQVGGSANASSVYFNASKKMSFTLFVDTELYEQGYVKLDEVRRNGYDYEYDITLYGGLGDFFYNLSINDDGNEMKLSDLELEDDIDFKIDLNTVKEAWDSLKNNTDDKWQTINFMPAYNGLPEDFDADKMLIDTKSVNLVKTKAEDGKTYTTKEGWVMAELPDEMTEWETRDLRSYLQRPCIRMKEVIKACCDPVNNGGYEVELDSDFFNENNAYWEKTWLTLPMLQTLEYDSGEQVLEDSILVTEDTTGDTSGYMYQSLNFDRGEYPSTVVNKISLSTTIKANIGNRYTSHVWFWNKNGDSYHTGWWCVGSLFCQLLAYNGDTVIGASEAVNLTSPIRHNGKLWYGDNSDYTDGKVFTPYMSKSIRNILGDFRGDGFTAENESAPAVITFTINGLTTNVTDLKMCYFWGASKDKLKKTKGPATLFKTITDIGWLEHSMNSATTYNPANMDMAITSTSFRAVMGGTIGRTGTEVTKRLMLNTEASPCDYLLSYCKMFGLYFSKSLYEDKIYIQTRKSFYDRNKIVDISGDIDYSQGTTLTPIAFDAKWVHFTQESDDTQFATDYMTAKGVAYGSKVLNTGYEFDSSKKALLEDNIIRSAVEGLEKSKYFTCYNNDSKVRPFFGYGMKYNLYNGDDTIELNGSNASGSNLLGINEAEGLKYYDTFPKVQFHDKKNTPTDGNNVLVFFSGFKDMTTERANPINYFLTDDSYWQSTLNEGVPCWLFVSEDKTLNGKDIAKKLTEIPVFERYLTDSNGTTVKKSLDFGSAQELYIPKYSITENVNIYYNFWKTYLEDLYDINTKIFTAYVRLKGKVGYDLLKQFYWFDNGIWRINKITDWNIGLDEATKVEFVKVQDLTDYTSVTQTKANIISLKSNKYIVSANGDLLTLNLSTLNGGKWTVKSSDGLIISQSSGEGDKQLLVVVPQSTTPSEQRTYTITAVDDQGNTATISLVQRYYGDTQFSVSPSALIVPAQGGSYNVDIQWVNQGSVTMEDAVFQGDVTGSVELDDYSATVTVAPSGEDDTVISGKVVFDSTEGTDEVGIDQMPAVLSFSKSGGEYEFIYNYNEGVRYSYLPYWATVEGNKLTVIPNYYETERKANVMIDNGKTFAYVLLQQDAGNTPSVGALVSPDTLNFSKEGGVQYVSVGILNTWMVTKPLEWADLNINVGDGQSILGVTVAENLGGGRMGTIVITDMSNRKEYTLTVTQSGQSSNPSLALNTTAINASKNGGDYEVTVLYTDREGNDVLVQSDLEHSDINWKGDVGYMTIYVPKNETVEEKISEIVFTSPAGTVTLVVTQEAGDAFITVDADQITMDMYGGSELLWVSSNVRWVCDPSETWLHISPQSGEANTDTEVYITIDKNMDEVERIGRFYFKSAETEQTLLTVNVKQLKFVEDLRVEPSSVMFDADGGTATITISSNADWTIEINE